MVNSFWNGFGWPAANVGPPESGGTTNVASAARTAARSIEPKSVTVPLESPSLAVVHEDGASPAPHMSFQWNWPPVAKRARARPMISTLEPVSGAYQSGASIAASGGMSPLSTAPTAAPTLARPQPKCGVHCSSGGSVGSAAGSGTPVPDVLPSSTRSAVCSSSSRISSGRSAMPWSRPALTTSPAAPAALLVLTEPVAPSIEIELLPPYWVVLAPRKKLCTGAFEPKHAGWPVTPQTFSPSRNCLLSSPRPSVSGTVP